MTCNSRPFWSWTPFLHHLAFLFNSWLDETSSVTNFHLSVGLFFVFGVLSHGVAERQVKKSVLVGPRRMRGENGGERRKKKKKSIKCLRWPHPFDWVETSWVFCFVSEDELVKKVVTIHVLYFCNGRYEPWPFNKTQKKN